MNIHAKKTPTEDRINQDQELHQQIVDLNTQIQDLNSSLNVWSTFAVRYYDGSQKPVPYCWRSLGLQIISDFLFRHETEGVEDTSRLEERLQMCIYKFDELF
jgi:hypothetical protein